LYQGVGFSFKEREVIKDNMVNPAYLEVLRKLHAELAGGPVTWVVTGSCGFALQGAPVEPHDIDIQSNESGVYEIERRFSEFSVKKVTFSATDRMRSHFGALSINGIKVELMGDIQKRLEDGDWEAPVNLEKYKQVVVVEGMALPVLSLAYEHTAYLKLGRIHKAEMLREWLQERGESL
jgi:hypothetical protein